MKCDMLYCHFEHVWFIFQNETVVDFPDTKPFDLAIDPYSHSLFYTCSQNNVINFTHIDLKVSGTVVSGNGIRPRYLAINPLKG